ncbi:MAG: hypothetical protein A3K19_14750 [Lentisphaerae bacterium RIFOXYB12_FULL_65_16]|nr:MAG: hypothetical protein A3K18_14415 [Lentisphaerae bacterium RIFOXYA12_64_32]OGV87835.1 MAG: hypothetical protein A3K19_14750 [Lentisphaerae bacterium RIFOXYB12_FULL_65_16]
MKHPVLALFTRELRHDARAGRTYLLRLALLGMVFLQILSAKGLALILGAPGLRFFTQVTALNFVLITFVGVSYFATAITEEKEERTLGLLRMTALSPLAILLGKSTTRLITMVALLAVQLPFTVLAITLGGVSLAQIVATYCSFLGFLVLLSGIGLFCSVMCRRNGNASGLAFLLLLVLLLGPWLAYGAMQAAAQATATTMGVSTAELRAVDRMILAGLEFLTHTTLFYALGQAFRTGSGGLGVIVQVVSNILMGGVFFLLAWRCFDRFSRDDAETAPKRLPVQQAPMSVRRLVRPGRTWRRALVWKEFHFAAGGRVSAVVKPLIILAVAFMAHGSNNAWSNLTQIDAKFVGSVIMGTSLLVLAGVLVLSAANVFDSEIKAKTLTGLMLLPMSPGRLACHKVSGHLLAVLPELAMFALGALMNPGALWNILGDMADKPWTFYVLALFVFFLYGIASMSLVTRRGAVGLTFGTVVVVNFLVLGVAGDMMSREWRDLLPWLATAVLVGLTVWLHVTLPGRLRMSAGEG